MLRAAVLGTGLMGTGIAGVLAGHGYRVQLYDADPAASARAAAAWPGQATAHRDLRSAVADADVVVEAVTERLPVKQELFAQVDAINKDALLTTNTSVLPVSQIAARVSFPDRMVGTHWWNPPGLIPVVEVVRGQHTSEQTMDRAEDLLRSLGKMPVRVERDLPGFVGNRLQHALKREAIALVADGICTAETVDTVTRYGFGARLGIVGPLEQSDLSGLELTLAIHRTLMPVLDNTPVPHPLLVEKVRNGETGAAAGRGFRQWRPGEAQARREQITRELAELVTARLKLEGDQ